MAAKKTNQKTGSPPKADCSPLWVWHPEVHERFGEQLIYFLLAVRPFRRDEHDSAVKELMQKFSIPRYCSYQVFGSFDSLLRVWLPPLAVVDFKREVERLPGFQSVHDFDVVETRRYWALIVPKDRNITNDTLENNASALTVEQVRAEQTGILTLQQYDELEKKCLLLKRPSLEAPKTIKAFIAFSPPEQNYNKKVQENIKEQIESVLTVTKPFCFQSVSLMFGQGFCWALAKVVATKYTDLGRCVNEVSSRLGLHGISTQTHLVVDFPSPSEGDSISGVALSLSMRGHPQIARFLPELYDASDMGEVERSTFVEFVKGLLRQDEPVSTKINELPIDDLDTMRNFLKAAILDDRDAAFVALFPALKNAERFLRDPVGRSAAKLYPGGTMALLDFLRQQKGNPPASLSKMSLRDMLQAGREILRKVTPNDDWLAKWNDKDFEEIGEVRNTVMHDKPFTPRKEWKVFAERMLKLFEIRDGFQLRYEQLNTQVNE